MIDRYSHDAASKRRTDQTLVVSVPGWSPVLAAEEKTTGVFIFKVTGWVNKQGYTDEDPSTKPELGNFNYIGAGSTYVDRANASEFNIVSGITINEVVSYVEIETYIPTTSPWVVYNEADGNIYVWDGNEWYNLGKSTTDTSIKADKAQGAQDEILVDDGLGNPTNSGVKINPAEYLSTSMAFIPTEKVVTDALNATRNDLELTIQSVYDQLNDLIMGHIQNLYNPHGVGLNQLTNYDADGNVISNVGAPESPGDAVNLQYLEEYSNFTGDYIRTKLTSIEGEVQDILVEGNGIIANIPITSNIVTINVKKETSAITLVFPLPTADYLDSRITIINNSEYGKVGVKTNTNPIPDYIVNPSIPIGTNEYKCSLVGTNDYKWTFAISGDALRPVMYSGETVVQTQTTDTNISFGTGTQNQVTYVNAGINTAGTCLVTIPQPYRSFVSNQMILDINDITSARPLQFSVYGLTIPNEAVGDCIYVFTAIYDSSTNNSKYIYNRYCKYHLIDEDNMVSNRADIAPSQQSVKAYVDNKFIEETYEDLSSFFTLGWSQTTPESYAYIKREGKLITLIMQMGIGQPEEVVLTLPDIKYLNAIKDIVFNGYDLITANPILFSMNSNYGNTNITIRCVDWATITNAVIVNLQYIAKT